MQGTICPDVALAAVALQRSHPHATPRDVLDLVLYERTGCLADLAEAIEPGTDFAAIVAAVFDPKMSPENWRWVANHLKADPVVLSALRVVWTYEVLHPFAAAYGLALKAAG